MDFWGKIDSVDEMAKAMLEKYIVSLTNGGPDNCSRRALICLSWEYFFN
jgi:hypothetical protein